MFKLKVKSEATNFKHHGMQINRTYQGVIEVYNSMNTKLYSLTCIPVRLTLNDALEDAKNDCLDLV